MHENDRSATGYLPGPEFEATADRFFAEPQISVRGWERAIDAQARILGAVAETLARHPGGDLLLVGHGAVGTLELAEPRRYLQVTRPVGVVAPGKEVSCQCWVAASSAPPR